jgi:hypothetical protein
MLDQGRAPAAPRPTTMKRPSIRAAAALVAATIAVIAAAALLAPSSPQHASHAPESIFQDDDHLIYDSTATVARTLDLLKALGVDRIRVTIEWAYIAPDPTSSTEPVGFDAADPADYPHGAWSRYDRVVEMAAAHGIGVDFNVTAPGPLWAMRPMPVSTQLGAGPAEYEPSATDFGQFVQALGTRYSGAYLPSSRRPGLSSTLLPSLASRSSTRNSIRARRPLPRVAFWSIWNEPNQPGWLAPQWRTVGKQSVPDSPRLYRSLLDAAVKGLELTGHTLSSDTILVGETAPEGEITEVKVAGHERYFNRTGSYDAMSPMVFVRALYCVNSSYRRLTGAAASALGCPPSGSAHAFATENPGLFHAAGFAHHPYFFLFAPSINSPVADFVPLADLGRLERGLDRIFAAYAINRQIPIYLTEYGYQTNPPNPNQNVTPAEQAVYLNEADYMAWRDPRVRSMAQFLLYDAGPNTAYPPSSYDYWGSTFQTGLIFGPGTSRDGRRKPAFAAYRLPIWIPTTKVRPGSQILIWGMLRLAPKDTAQKAMIQWRPAHGRGFRTLATVRVPASAIHGYFTTHVTLPGTGRIRIAWRSAAGKTFTSRVVGTVASSPSPIAGVSAFATIQNAFDASANQTISACQFSSAELAKAQGSVPNDDQQYDQNLVAAIEQARQEQADGACGVKTRTAVASVTTPASTPTPPAAPALGQNTPLRVGSATAATDSGLPVAIAILIVLGALLAVPAAVLGAIRLLGWDPAWEARLRHSLAEAGYRVADIWSAFGDRIRRGP